MYKGAQRTRDRRCLRWALRHVMFEDVGFQNLNVQPLIHISCRCEVRTPSVVEGQSTIIFKSHILEHHIPELPTSGLRVAGAASPGGHANKNDNSLICICYMHISYYICSSLSLSTYIYIYIYTYTYIYICHGWSPLDPTHSATSTASRRGRDKQGRRRSAAIPHDELSCRDNL